jgi:hypothetical protein
MVNVGSTDRQALKLGPERRSIGRPTAVAHTGAAELERPVGVREAAVLE